MPAAVMGGDCRVSEGGGKIDGGRRTEDGGQPGGDEGRGLYLHSVDQQGGQAAERERDGVGARRAAAFDARGWAAIEAVRQAGWIRHQENYSAHVGTHW